MVPDVTKVRARQKNQLEVLLVEDNPTDVLLVRSHIEDSTDFHLETAERLSRAIECVKVKDYDIILLDLNLPDATGLEALIKLRAYVEGVAVVVFTGLNDEQLGIMALQRGAQDYLVKGVDSDRLVRSMRYAIERLRVHSLQNPIESSDDGPVETVYQSKSYEVLTEREMQVLKLLGKGYTNQEILQTLGICLTTVKTHIGSIFQKLSVSDRTRPLLRLTDAA